MDKTEQILKYLKHQLHGKLLEEVELRIETDDDFREEVEDYKKIFDGFKVKKATEFHDKLRQWAIEDDENEKATTNSDDDYPDVSASNSFANFSIDKNSFAKIAVALSICLIVFFGIKNYFSENTVVHIIYGQELVNLELTQSALEIDRYRGGNTRGGKIIKNTPEAEIAFNKAKKAYEKEKFQQCISEIITIKNNEGVYPKAINLSAHAHFQLTNYSESAKIFKQIYDNEEYRNKVGRVKSGQLYYLSEIYYYQNSKTSDSLSNAISAIEHFIEKAYEIDDKEEIEKARKIKIELLKEKR